MNNIKLLKNLKSELYRYEDLDDESYESIVMALESINDDLDDYTSDEEYVLYRECEGMVAVAEKHLADIEREAERDCIRDEMRYESMRHFS